MLDSVKQYDFDKGHDSFQALKIGLGKEIIQKYDDKKQVGVRCGTCFGSLNSHDLFWNSCGSGGSTDRRLKSLALRPMSIGKLGCRRGELALGLRPPL